MVARQKNVKLYWKLLSGRRSFGSCPISTADWYNHFLNLSNPSDDFYTADDDISDELKNFIENDLHATYDLLDMPSNVYEIQKSYSKA